MHFNNMNYVYFPTYAIEAIVYDEFEHSVPCAGDDCAGAGPGQPWRGLRRIAVFLVSVSQYLQYIRY